MTHKFSPDVINRVASILKCDVPAILAVIQVEAAGDGFLPDGRPKILFERHIFSRLTERKFNVIDPAVSNKVAGGYVGGAGEYSRLYRAAQLDADAAVQSASWGACQIMGFNWKMTGEKSLIGFLLAMHNGVDAHLHLFAQYILAAGLADELREHRWADFARKYNGPAYASNKYDTKLAAAHAAQTGVA